MQTDMRLRIILMGLCTRPVYLMELQLNNGGVNHFYNDVGRAF